MPTPAQTQLASEIRSRLLRVLRWTRLNFEFDHSHRVLVGIGVSVFTAVGLGLWNGYQVALAGGTSNVDDPNLIVGEPTAAQLFLFAWLGFLISTIGRLAIAWLVRKRFPLWPAVAVAGVAAIALVLIPTDRAEAHDGGWDECPHTDFGCLSPSFEGSDDAGIAGWIGAIAPWVGLPKKAKNSSRFGNRMSNMIAGPQPKKAVDVRAIQKVTGRTRPQHRNSANKGFFDRLLNDPRFKKQMDDLFGTDVAKHMKSGKSSRLRNPPRTEWHHPVQGPGDRVWLMGKGGHRSRGVQDILHPGPSRSGGFPRNFGK